MSENIAFESLQPVGTSIRLWAYWNGSHFENYQILKVGDAEMTCTCGISSGICPIHGSGVTQFPALTEREKVNE